MSSNNYIDLRSDTVTRPTPAMRKAMADAVVGDDVYGEDPTINRLQEKVAKLLGKDTALFVPSGAMGNQIAIKTHTQPGDEIIAESGAHVFNYETAAPSFISQVQVQTIPGKRGVLRVEDLVPAVRSSAYYMPRTSLVCLENTHNKAGGTIYPLDEIKKIRAFTHERKLALHLDGARLWNASVATGVSPKEYSKYFDSVAVCFSKGLGAPVGSALAGTKEFIERARKYRKILGGGMRQAGVIAAGALYALEHHIDRLKEDHEKAKVFAETLSSVNGLEIDQEAVQTNIIIINVGKTGRSPAQILEALRKKKVLLVEMSYTAIRAVMHMDVTFSQVKEAAGIIKALFKA
ncbi:MAG: low-specificity L-threonine aldolase [Ignavibacteriae bacterium]|nr:low-specificity L-threonine aldolase [Ignavibacteriota bacterium]